MTSKGATETVEALEDGDRIVLLVLELIIDPDREIDLLVQGLRIIEVNRKRDHQALEPVSGQDLKKNHQVQCKQEIIHLNQSNIGQMREKSPQSLIIEHSIGQCHQKRWNISQQNSRTCHLLTGHLIIRLQGQEIGHHLNTNQREHQAQNVTIINLQNNVKYRPILGRQTTEVQNQERDRQI